MNTGRYSVILQKRIIMKIKIFNAPGDLKLFRGRLFNFRLIGNIRFGRYKEISYNDIKSFIQDFRAFRKHSTERPPLPEGSDFAILERLCEQYYVYENTDRLRNGIVREVEGIIDRLRHDGKALQTLEDWLNASQDGIVAKVREKHPELTEQDIRLFCYLSAGFTPTMISVLLGKDKSVVYNRTSRLKAKLKE